MNEQHPPTLAQKTTLPDRIGPYDIECELGQGGMGMVYRGYDPHLDRGVAIKVLYPHLARDREFARRFLREARTAARIEHPNVVAVYAADDLESGQGCYIAMQFVDGIELHRLIKDRGPLPVDLALAIARDIAAALGAAHDQGLVHRDVKPDNVLIDRTGRVRVTDFGLARPVAGDVRITETGVFLGTPEYSAPEQCSSEEIDHRADLYSLGVVLYEMLSGQLPHKAPTPYALFQRIVEETPVSIRTLNHAVPKPVESLVMADLLAKKPELRLADAATLVARIEALLADLGSAGKDFRPVLAGAVSELAAAPRPSSRVPSERDSHETFAYSTRVPSSIPAQGPAATAASSSLFPHRHATLAAVLAIALVASASGWLAFRHTRTVDQGSGQDQAAAPSNPTPGVDEPAPRKPEPSLETLPVPVKVAILDFEVEGPENRDPEFDWYRVGLTQLVISSFYECSALQVIDRDAIRQQTAGEESPLGDLALCERLGVGLIVRGRYSIFPGRMIYCTLSVMLSNGSIVARSDRRGAADDLFDVVHALSQVVLDVLQSKLGGGPTPPMARPEDLDKDTEPPAPATSAYVRRNQTDRVADALARSRDHLASLDRDEIEKTRKAKAEDMEEASDDRPTELDEALRRQHQRGAAPGSADSIGKLEAGAEEGERPGDPERGAQTFGGGSDAGREGAEHGQRAELGVQTEGGDSQTGKSGETDGENGEVQEPAEQPVEAQKEASSVHPALRAYELWSRARILVEEGDATSERIREAVRLLTAAVELAPDNELYVRELEGRLDDLTKKETPSGE